jgi:hypothetical protein
MKTTQNRTINKHNKSNNIIYLTDNIFDIVEQRINAANIGGTVIIPHVCNNVNAYGAGFALDVANKYPNAKANFHLLGNQAKLGHTQFVIAQENKQYKHKVIIANMIAQNGLKNFKNPRPLNYVSLVACMSQIKSYIHSLQKNDDTYTNIEIHAPKFGSGLAGGNWNFIEHIIEDLWTNIPTFIYELRK